MSSLLNKLTGHSTNKTTTHDSTVPQAAARDATTTTQSMTHPSTGTGLTGSGLNNGLHQSNLAGSSYNNGSSLNSGLAGSSINNNGLSTTSNLSGSSMNNGLSSSSGLTGSTNTGLTGSSINNGLSSTNTSIGSRQSGLGSGIGSSIGSTSASAYPAGSYRSDDRINNNNLHTQQQQSRLGENAMTRSEEQLRVQKATVPAGKAELNKYVTTEHVSQAVPVSQEKVVLEREPINASNMGQAMKGPAISEAHYETTLKKDIVTAQKDTVPVERIRLAKQTETGIENIQADLRKEHIDLTTDAQDKIDMGRSGSNWNSAKTDSAFGNNNNSSWNAGKTDNLHSQSGWVAGTKTDNMNNAAINTSVMNTTGNAINATTTERRLA